MANYYGDLSKSIEDPKVVTIQADLYGWHTPKNNILPEYTTIPLGTHPCTADELGFGDDKSLARFYPVQEE